MPVTSQERLELAEHFRKSKTPQLGMLEIYRFLEQNDLLKNLLEFYRQQEKINAESVD